MKVENKGEIFSLGTSPFNSVLSTFPSQGCLPLLPFSCLMAHMYDIVGASF